MNIQNNLQKKTFSDFDKLNLKSFAENLLQNIEKGIESPIEEQEGSYTVSLNAAFGNGKTTFLEMFQSFMEDKKKYNVISINAWTSDFYVHPIISILYEWLEFIESQKMEKKAKKEFINKIKKKIINVAHQFFRNKTGLDIKEVWNDTNTVKNETILDTLKQIKSAVKELKAIIQKYTEDKKLLIIVDELDRARPDYAVHFLEDMKHFFDVKNIIFLVAVNRNQMENTVKCLYGQNLNFNGYYRKFFKQEIELPDPYQEAQNFVDNLIKKTKVNFHFQTSKKEYTLDNVYYSCKMFNLTLREVEQFMRIFDAVLGHDTAGLSLTYMDCYSFFICFSIKQKNIFKQILNKQFSIDSFLNYVKELSLPEDPKHYLRYLLKHVAYSFLTKKTKPSYIEKIFNILLPHPENLHFLRYENLTLSETQPAFIICEKINQCKSHFSR
ncbi:MAG: hypothetical protein GDA46_04175 [Bdellovibrionales bacterium]|nr:hypothetical protein [Bdellovibrionales bacterium]